MTLIVDNVPLGQSHYVYEAMGITNDTTVYV